VSEVITIGLDIAKYVFHVHGADERGRAILSKRISRGKLLDFFAARPSCRVALEACGGAHHWARQLTQLGHEVCTRQQDRKDSLGDDGEGRTL
jgi:transposase